MYLSGGLWIHVERRNTVEEGTMAASRGCLESYTECTPGSIKGSSASVVKIGV